MIQKCPNCHKLVPDGSRYCSNCGHDMAFTMPADGILPPGTTLRGTYVIDHMVGEGGMGVVYACHHKTLNTPFALKVLDPKLARITTTRMRFLSEGKIQAHLAHPHIVRVADVIDSEKEGNGILAIAMEYVKGDSLDHIIQERQLSVFDAVSITLVVLDAIGTAHKQKIIHRDLKPSNIMICEELAHDALYKGVKVMDFGIAKLMEEEQPQLTVTGCQMGTPLYMPPEQIKNARMIDERADLYALGVTLYELLCGRTPFAQYRDFELYQAQLTMQPPSIKNFRRDLPDTLEAIIMKSLAKDPENRYPNAVAFQRALLGLGGFDDIPLLLNPMEGMSIQSTNVGLQRKISNAIKKNTKSNEETNSTQKKQKAEKVAQAMKVAVGTKIDAEEKSIDSEVVAEQGQDAVESNAVSSAKKSRVVDAMPSEEPASKTKKSRVVEPVDADETSSRSKKTRASDKDKANDAKKRTRTPVDEGKNSVSAERVKVKKKQKTVVDDAEIVEKNAGRKSSTFKKVERVPSVSVRNAKTVMNDEAPHSKLKTRLKMAVVLVALILLVLAASGLVYRENNDMPKATVDAPEEAIVVPVATLPEDVSKVPFSEIVTPTGRMTKIPAAKHLVSTKKSDELRQIELPDFWIDQVEVSNYQYAKCVAKGICPPVKTDASPVQPVTGVGLGSAEAFCKFAGKRLPTAEEWEAAARFGGKSNGITYVEVSCDTVHFGAEKDCAKKNPKAPESVYSRANGANPGHLRNMLGNVREWVSTVEDNKAQTRGGSYLSNQNNINISVSQLQNPNQGSPDLGFRCVK